jgi:hypothetical protein
MYTSKVFLLEKFSFFKFCRKTRYIFFRITQKLQENNYFQGNYFLTHEYEPPPNQLFSP